MKRLITIEVDDDVFTNEVGTAAANTVDKHKRAEVGRSFRELLMHIQYVDQRTDAASHLNMFFGVKVIADEQIA